MARETVHTFTGLAAEAFMVECRDRLRGTDGTQALQIVSIDELRLELEEDDGWSVVLDTEHFANLDVLDDGSFTDALLFAQLKGPVVDEYDETNWAGSTGLIHSATHTKKAQVFELTTRTAITGISAYLRRTGSPPGNVTGRIYAVDGDIDTGQPTGAALASATVAASSLPTSPADPEMTAFDFADELILEAGVYAAAIEYDGGDGSNAVAVGQDTSAATHAGHYESYNGTAWVTQASTIDMIFEVRGRVCPPPSGDYMLVAECTVEYVDGSGSGQTETTFRRPARVVASALNPVA